MENKLEIIYSIPKWKDILLSILSFLLFGITLGYLHEYTFDLCFKHIEYLNRKRLLNFLYNNCITQEEIQENLKEINKSKLGTFFHFEDFQILITPSLNFSLFDKNNNILTSSGCFSKSQKKISSEIILVLKYIEKIYDLNNSKE